MFSVLKGRLDRFDVHIKTIDGVNKQTLIGALLTVASFIIIISLIVSEVTQYSSKDVLSRLIADTYQSRESIKIVMDIEFPRLLCDRISYSQEITRGSFHVYDNGQHINKVPSNAANGSIPMGCRVSCQTITDKVGGTIKFSFEHPPVSDGFIDIPFEAPDLTHTIHSLSFLPADSPLAKEEDVPGVNHNPLGGQTSVGTGVGIYQYSMQIVPTQYTTLTRKVSGAHQYSVTERQVKLETALRGVMISSQAYRDFVGILITYDFYPVRKFIEHLE